MTLQQICDLETATNKLTVLSMFAHNATDLNPALKDAYCELLLDQCDVIQAGLANLKQAAVTS